MIEADKWKYFLMENSNPEKIKILSSFFKTGKGQYGEGDIFIGLTVPCNRKIAEQFCEENFDVIKILLHDPIHEFRLSPLPCSLYLPLFDEFKLNTPKMDTHFWGKIREYEGAKRF